MLTLCTKPAIVRSTRPENRCWPLSWIVTGWSRYEVVVQEHRHHVYVIGLNIDRLPASIGSDKIARLGFFLFDGQPVEAAVRYVILLPDDPVGVRIPHKLRHPRQGHRVLAAHPVPFVFVDHHLMPSSARWISWRFSPARCNADWMSRWSTSFDAGSPAESARLMTTSRKNALRCHAK